MKTIEIVEKNGLIKYKKPDYFKKLINSDFYDIYFTKKNRIAVAEWGDKFVAITEDGTVAETNYNADEWMQELINRNLSGMEFVEFLFEAGFITIYKN